MTTSPVVDSAVGLVGLVEGAFEGSGWWEKFVEVHHVATHSADDGGLKLQFYKAYYGVEHWKMAVRKCEFGPGEVVTYLTDKYAGDNEAVCDNPIVALFASVFAVGHALPTIRGHLEDTWTEKENNEDQTMGDNEETERRLGVLHEGDVFDAAWFMAKEAIDAFVSGKTDAITTLETINNLDLRYSID